MKTEVMDSVKNVIKFSSICCCRSAFMVYRNKSVCSVAAANFAFMKSEGI